MHHAPIDPSHAAFFQFREATRDLGGLSEAEQIRVLHRRLLEALQRAIDFQDRSRRLELQIDSLRTETSARSREHQAFAAQVARESAQARNEWEEILCNTHRDALAAENAFVSLKSQHDALAEICQSLLQTIERAASLEIAADPQASACA